MIFAYDWDQLPQRMANENPAMRGIATRVEPKHVGSLRRSLHLPRSATASFWLPRHSTTSTGSARTTTCSSVRCSGSKLRQTQKQLTAMPGTPGNKACQEIDPKLIKSSSLLQNRDELNLTTGRGDAVTEYPMKSGLRFANYLPYLERKPLDAVKHVEDGISVIGHLETDLESRRKSARASCQSILRHAFTGQPVPQDPQNEPAAEFLKRTAAQHSEYARITKRPGRKSRPFFYPP